MVTTEFKKNAYEGYDEAQNVYALATGNAFVADGMKRETINALQNAMMNGADDDSSIATAAMKLSGHFKSSASKQNDKKDKGLSMGEMALLQQVNGLLDDLYKDLKDLRQEKEAIEFKLEILNEIDELDEQGLFDPLNNQNHMQMMLDADEGLTEEEVKAMSSQDITDWRRDRRERLEERSNEIDKLEKETEQSILAVEDIESKLQNDSLNFPLNEPFMVINNSFQDVNLELAAVRLGDDFDRYNITEENLQNLLDELNRVRVDISLEKDALDTALDNKSEVTEIVNLSNGFDFQA